MPTPTYTPLANITLGSSAASVTFSSISQAYRDLVIVCTPATTTGVDSLKVNFNGDSGSNYSSLLAWGTGATASSTTVATTYGYLAGAYATASSLIINVMDYAATNKHKSILARGDNAANQTMMSTTRWANTAAVTSIALSTSPAFAAGSTFALYGIAA